MARSKLESVALWLLVSALFLTTATALVSLHYAVNGKGPLAPALSEEIPKIPPVELPGKDQGYSCFDSEGNERRGTIRLCEKSGETLGTCESGLYTCVCLGETCFWHLFDLEPSE